MKTANAGLDVFFQLLTNVSGIFQIFGILMLAGVWMPGLASAGQVGKIEYGPPVWTNLGSGMNSDVWCLAYDGTNLYAGGTFTNAGEVAANCVAKWNGFTWTNLGSGVTGTDTYTSASSVSDLVYDGTNLYACGVFTNAGGVAANRVAKWNGNSWTNLGSGMNS